MDHPFSNHNHHDLTNVDLHRAYGFLFNAILSHLTLVWAATNGGDLTLLDTLKQNVECSDVLSEASKELLKVILHAADASWRITADQVLGKIN